MPRSNTLQEIALLFFRLGATAFGGPVAHIALMEKEFVRRLRWLTQEQFLDLVSATHLIPGPNSTELALHIGYLRAGWRGLVVAGLCFILPGALITMIFVGLYQAYAQLPKVTDALYGISPVILAIVLQAIWSLRKTVTSSHKSLLLGAVSVAEKGLGFAEIPILFLAGFMGWLMNLSRKRSTTVAMLAALSTHSIHAWSAVASGQALQSLTLGKLFWSFLKIGSTLFGSGYVLLSFLRTDFVERLGWLTENQLIDAVAIGQFTPGPLFTTATFIGYQLGGFSGASLATFGIFLPAFLLVGLTAPIITRLRSSRAVSGILDAVNAASLAFMVWTAGQLALSTLKDAVSWGIFLMSMLMLQRYKTGSAGLIISGAMIGLMSRRI